MKTEREKALLENPTHFFFDEVSRNTYVESFVCSLPSLPWLTTTSRFPNKHMFSTFCTVNLYLPITYGTLVFEFFTV